VTVGHRIVVHHGIPPRILNCRIAVHPELRQLQAARVLGADGPAGRSDDEERSPH
jgi:hypothetical protein